MTWLVLGSSEVDVNPLIPPYIPSTFSFPSPGLTNIPSILPTWWLPPNTGVVSRFATYSVDPCKHSPSSPSELLDYILALLLKREWIITSLIAYNVSLGLFHVGLSKYAPPKYWFHPPKDRWGFVELCCFVDCCSCCLYWWLFPHLCVLPHKK